MGLIFENQIQPMLFENRRAAGRQIADLVNQENEEVDIVLGIVPGGVEVGREVAERLDAEFDVIVSKSLDAPGNPGLTIGGVTSNGTLYLEDRAVENIEISEDYIREARREAWSEAYKEEREYRDQDESSVTLDKDVLIVDDGARLSARVMAAVGHVRKSGPSSLKVGIPVTSRQIADEIREAADSVFVSEEPYMLNDVSDCYRYYPHISSSEVSDMLSLKT